jgi:hypothetical protein
MDETTALFSGVPTESENSSAPRRFRLPAVHGDEVGQDADRASLDDPRNVALATQSLKPTGLRRTPRAKATARTAAVSGVEKACAPAGRSRPSPARRRGFDDLGVSFAAAGLPPWSGLGALRQLHLDHLHGGEVRPAREFVGIEAASFVGSEISPCRLPDEITLRRGGECSVHLRGVVRKPAIFAPQFNASTAFLSVSRSSSPRR